MQSIKGVRDQSATSEYRSPHDRDIPTVPAHPRYNCRAVAPPTARRFSRRPHNTIKINRLQEKS
jgi:hypothetical protein